jgi:hypothetical protein
MVDGLGIDLHTIFYAVKTGFLVIGGLCSKL